jgi:hypothetical protein
MNLLVLVIIPVCKGEQYSLTQLVAHVKEFIVKQLSIEECVKSFAPLYLIKFNRLTR